MTRHRLAVALTLAAWPSVAAAQGLQFDASLAYSARDEVTVQDGDGDRSYDNDIFRLTTGLAWGLGDGRVRTALELGVRNEDFSGEYPALLGGEVVYGRRVGNQRYAVGGRVRNDEGLSTTTELAYIAQHLGDVFGLRGMAGVQFIADADVVRGRDGASPFGLLEASVYANDDWVFSAGGLADPDGSVYGVGTEYRVGGTVSIFASYAEAFDDYRGVVSYDQLTAGIRIVPGAGSLRAGRQATLHNVMDRFVEVQ